MTTLCIIFTTEAFYPKLDSGESTSEMPFAAYTLLLSLVTASYGITKFFLTGPLPIIPKTALLGGMLSIRFLTFLLLNTMFVVRTFSLEASFFANYRQHINSNRAQNTNDIDPLIPEEYRLIIYLLPGLLSFVVNLIRLALTMKPKDLRYFKNFPQFILCPMFSPLMFEGNPDQKNGDEPPIRVWKIGSILNSLFMGCLPQILLLALDKYRQVPSWLLKSFTNYDSNTLIKHPYGNITFSITSLLLYLLLTTIFFAWNKCSSPMSQKSDPSTGNTELDAEKHGEKSIIDQSTSFKDATMPTTPSPRQERSM